jgi:putative oxidoreductase
MFAQLFAGEFVADADAASLGVLVLRVCAGLAMASHGWAKFTKGGKIAGTAGWFDSMGMRPGRFHARLAASTELGAGLLLAVGLFVPLAALAFVALMFVAGYTVHRPNGFFSVNNGYELNVIFAVLAVGVATVGAGRYSIDSQLGLIEDFDGWVGLVIAAVGGVGAAVTQLAVFYRPPADQA